MTETTQTNEIVLEGDDLDLEFTASYSPEDDKLRIRVADGKRFSSEVWMVMKTAGKFKWAPKQKLYVAYWSPRAEDICLDLAGHIGEEETSLEERTLQRYDRFTGYLLDRTEEAADAANRAESLVGDGVVGNQRASVTGRKVRKIDRAKAAAANLWSKSEYWTWRSKGVVKSHLYKNQPEVRHRRIKRLRTDVRRWESQYTIDEKTPPDTTSGDEPRYWCGVTGGWRTMTAIERSRQWWSRWIEHANHRIMYEQIMLEAQDGDNAAKFDIQVGGEVRIDEEHGVDEWLTVLRVNKSPATKEINSVSTSPSKNRKFESIPKFGIEKIKDYRPPDEDGKAVVKKAALPPLCNYNNVPSVQAPSLYRDDRLETWELKELTKKEYARIPPDYKGTRVIDGTHRVRVAKREGSYYIFLTDQKERLPPKADKKGTAMSFSDGSSVVGPGTPAAPTVVDVDERQHKAKAIRSSIKDRVEKVANTEVVEVNADQLFETPDSAIEAMFDMVGGLDPNMKFGEFSAGTGRIVKALFNRGFYNVQAVEIDSNLTRLLQDWRSKIPNTAAAQGLTVIRGDFLAMEPGRDCSMVDVAMINPPFKNGDDLKHIKHALKFIKPGGKMVAICGGGPRKRAFLSSNAQMWSDLPPGTFKAAGTNVETLIGYFEVW